MNVQKIFANGGYYVEAGAHDGVGDSQTIELERSGKWDGICVEPSSAFNGLRRNRKCHVDNRCLWSHSNLEVVFREVKGNAIELSGIKKCFADHWDREERPHRDVFKKTVSLTDLLDKFKAPDKIEFLALDTEGSEYPILSTHDFGKYLFLLISVEHNGVQFKKVLLRKLLRENGYRIMEEDSINDWYIHESV